MSGTLAYYKYAHVIICSLGIQVVEMRLVWQSSVLCGYRKAAFVHQHICIHLLLQTLKMFTARFWSGYRPFSDRFSLVFSEIYSRNIFSFICDFSHNAICILFFHFIPLSKHYKSLWTMIPNQGVLPQLPGVLGKIVEWLSSFKKIYIHMFVREMKINTQIWLQIDVRLKFSIPSPLRHASCTGYTTTLSLF